MHIVIGELMGIAGRYLSNYRLIEGNNRARCIGTENQSFVATGVITPANQPAKLSPTIDYGAPGVLVLLPANRSGTVPQGKETRFTRML